MELFLTAFPCCDWEALICNALHHYIVQNPKSLSPPKQHGCILRSWSTLGHLFSSSILLPLPFPPFLPHKVYPVVTDEWFSQTVFSL